METNVPESPVSGVHADEQLQPQRNSRVVIFDWIRGQTPLSLSVKAAAALVLWRVLGVRAKLAFLARHPWMTLVGIAAGIKAYTTLKSHIPYLMQKGLQTVIKIGMKYAMSALKGNVASGPNPQFRSEFQRCLQIQFPPFLPHVGSLVDAEDQVGDLYKSLIDLKSIMATASSQEKTTRIAGIFRQSVASLITKSLSFTYLLALEEFVLAVLLRTPSLSSSMSTPLEVCMKAVVEDIFLGSMVPKIATEVRAAVNTVCQEMGFGSDNGGEVLSETISREQFKLLLSGVRRRVNLGKAVSSTPSEQTLGSRWSGFLQSVLPTAVNDVIESTFASVNGSEKHAANESDRGLFFVQLLSQQDPSASAAKAFEQVMASHKNEEPQVQQDAAVVEKDDSDRSQGQDAAHSCRRECLIRSVARAWDLALSAPGRGLVRMLEGAMDRELDELITKMAFCASSQAGTKAADPKLLSVVVQVIKFFKLKEGLLTPDANSNPFFEVFENSVQDETAMQLQNIAFFNQTETQNASSQQAGEGDGAAMLLQRFLTQASK
eukprot:INCI11149.1.p1 GENE.INCI11149.1~~INCI11149.1.p1  ORF type:complete len:547 (+),score=112.07 INCI11149.1:105-1745(+)